MQVGWEGMGLDLIVKLRCLWLMRLTQDYRIIVTTMNVSYGLTRFQALSQVSYSTGKEAEAQRCQVPCHTGGLNPGAHYL